MSPMQSPKTEWPKLITASAYAKRWYVDRTPKSIINDIKSGKLPGEMDGSEIVELYKAQAQLATITAQRDELLQTVKAVQTMCHGAIRVRIDGIIAKCEVQNG